MLRVPFTLPDVGLREIKGMVYIADGFLVINFKDALLGIADVEEVKIEPAALSDLYVKKGLLIDKLVVEPKSIALLDVIPGDHPSSVKLKVWRKYRTELYQIVDGFYDLPLKVAD